MDWKTMSVGKKNALGFGFVLSLLIAISLISFRGVKGIVTNANQVIQGNRLDGDLAQKEVDHLNWASKVNALLTDDQITRLAVETDDHKCGFGGFLYGEGRKNAQTLVPSLSPLFKDIEAPHKALHDSAIHISKVFYQADHNLPLILSDRIIDHLRWALTVQSAMGSQKSNLGVEVDPRQCVLGKWMNSDQAKRAYTEGSPEYKQVWDTLVRTHASLHDSAAEINGLLASTTTGGALAPEALRQAEEVYHTKSLPALDRTLNILTGLKTEAENRLTGMMDASRIYSTETLPALVQVQEILKQLRTEARKHIMSDEVMLEKAQSTRRQVSILSVLAVILGAFLAFVISRSIVTVLGNISVQMDEGAEQVASASSQVAQTSQSLAEGASEQAASIEETSSSLEEMSAMIRQNADNARQADTLMKGSNAVVDKANQSMTGLTGAMKDISLASQETSKIVKTIDEIAFQTNLLALNAAVEAARAGEAGAGFAVVADEVRNLAMRAASAAKNTSSLIEGTVKKIDEGSRIVTATNEAFKEVASSVKTVGELINEISEASKEQAEGIGQLNKAIAEMDKVTQKNAANAEESAAASEEMNGQAQGMKDSAKELVALVGGTSRKIRPPVRYAPQAEIIRGLPHFE